MPSVPHSRRYQAPYLLAGPDFRKPTHENFQDIKGLSDEPVKMPKPKPDSDMGFKPRSLFSTTSGRAPPQYSERPSKRLKTESGSSYATAAFQVSLSESDAIQSSNGNTPDISNRIPELRTVTKMTSGKSSRARHGTANKSVDKSVDKPTNKLRKGRLRSRQEELEHDPIQDAIESQVQLDNTSGDDAISNLVMRRPEDRKGYRIQSITRRVGRISTSPDELQDEISLQYRPKKKSARATNFGGRDGLVGRSHGPRRISGTDSPPSSTDISKTRFPKKRGGSVERKPKTALAKVGLEVAAAVGNRHHYSSDTAPQVFLREDEPNGRIYPYLEDGTDLSKDFDWMVVDLPACNRIEYCQKEGSFVKIRGANMKEKGILVLQFSTDNVCQAFIRWMEGHHQAENHLGKVNSNVELGTLRQTFEHQRNEVEDWKMSQRSQTSTQEKPQDILYLERRQQPKMAPFKPSLEPSNPCKSRSQLSALGNPAEKGQALRQGMLSNLVDDSKYLTNHLPPQTGRETRASQRTARPMVNKPMDEPATKPKWSEMHRLWDQEWGSHPLTYRRTQVDKFDIPRLDEGEFLNDNIISFYLRYLQDEAERKDPVLAKRVLILSTFFYEKLKPTGGGGINYDGVRGWTSKIDITSYDYILVPVNESLHWYMVMICNAPSLLPKTDQSATPAYATLLTDKATTAADTVEVSQATDAPAISSGAMVCGSPLPESAAAETRDGDSSGSIAAGVEDLSLKEQVCTPIPGGESQEDQVDLVQSDVNAAPIREPSPSQSRPPFKIIVLDSLNAVRRSAIAHLKEYLVRELKDKKQITIQKLGKHGMRALNIPHQSNYSDCGVYILAYTQKFLENPDRFANGIINKSNNSWDLNPTGLRNKIRTTILHKRKEQNKLEDEQALAKAISKKRNPARASKHVTQEEHCPTSDVARSSPARPQQAAEEEMPRASYTQDKTANKASRDALVKGAPSREVIQPVGTKLPLSTPLLISPMKIITPRKFKHQQQETNPRSTPTPTPTSTKHMENKQDVEELDLDISIVAMFQDHQMSKNNKQDSAGNSIVPSIEPRDDATPATSPAGCVNASTDFHARSSPEQIVDTTGLIKEFSPLLPNSRSGAALTNNRQNNRGSSAIPADIVNEVLPSSSISVEIPMGQSKYFEASFQNALPVQKAQSSPLTGNHNEDETSLISARIRGLIASGGTARINMDKIEKIKRYERMQRERKALGPQKSEPSEAAKQAEVLDSNTSSSSESTVHVNLPGSALHSYPFPPSRSDSADTNRRELPSETIVDPSKGGSDGTPPRLSRQKRADHRDARSRQEIIHLSDDEVVESKNAKTSTPTGVMAKTPRKRSRGHTVTYGSASKKIAIEGASSGHPVHLVDDEEGEE